MAEPRCIHHYQAFSPSLVVDCYDLSSLLCVLSRRVCLALPPSTLFCLHPGLVTLSLVLSPELAPTLSHVPVLLPTFFPVLALFLYPPPEKKHQYVLFWVQMSSIFPGA